MRRAHETTLRSGAARDALGRGTGFSLVELVVVMVVVGVLAVSVSGFIARPLEGQRDLARRTTLVDLADQSLQRMRRELRRALPNSIRVLSDESGIELLRSVAGGRYRRAGGVDDPGGPNEVDHRADVDWLSFGGDSEFNVMSRLGGFAFSYGTPLAAGSRLAIYTTGSSVYSEAASGADPASVTPSSTTITLLDDSDEDHVVLSAPHRFIRESPNQRLYLLDGPVSYLCDVAAGTLTRYAGYPITAGQPSAPSLPPLSNGATTLVVDHLESCHFRYAPGGAARAGLITIQLVLVDSGERIHLLDQVHVDNVP